MTKFVSPGRHLLIDFWGANNLRNMALIEKTMREAAVACDATVLEIKLHAFGKNAGVTGVAILAESHISIHTWPETGYAALDVFVCGACDPRSALPILRSTFAPQTERIYEHIREGVALCN